MTKRFHVGDLLSVMTGRLHGPNGIGGVYYLLNHLTGESLFTHQLPRAMDAVAGFLVNTFPDLPRTGYHPDLAATDDWRDVPVAPAGIYSPMDPITELAGKMGKDATVVVVTTGDQSESQ